MPSAKQQRAAAKREARALTLLSSRDLDIFRVAARQCGLVPYTQEAAAGQRRHFRSAPHEVPQGQRTPFDAGRQDMSVDRAWRAQGAEA